MARPAQHVALCSSGGRGSATTPAAAPNSAMGVEMEIGLRARLVQVTDLELGECVVLQRGTRTCIGIVGRLDEPGAQNMVAVLRSSGDGTAQPPTLQPLGGNFAFVLDGAEFIPSVDISYMSFRSATPQVGTVGIDSSGRAFLLCAHPGSMPMALDVGSGEIVETGRLVIVATTSAWRIVRKELDDYIDVVPE
jgi:hypothetical protein